MASSSALGAIAVVAVILTAFGSYYYTATPLNAQVSSDRTSISTYEVNISSYQSEVSSMSAHPSTTTIYSTTTQTTTSTSTVTTTTTAYPIPDNVTVLFVNSGSIFNYGVSASTLSYSGSSSGSSISIPITPVYSGEQISITASCGGTCPNGMTFGATLYVNGTVVSESTGNAFTGLSISYTL